MKADTQLLNKAQKFVCILADLQHQGGVRADELIDRYGLDDRTLRRYLSDLKDIDVPVVDDGRGVDRVLSVDPNFGRKSVQLSLLELVSLRFGRSLFNFLEGTGFAQDMDDALERISTWSGGADAPGGEVADLERKFVAVPEHHKDHSRDADNLDDILTALLRQNAATALYARVGGKLKSYTLHPYTLAHWRQGLYLYALDVDAGVVKTFAVDRFRAFKYQRGEVFSYPEDFDPDDLVKDCFGIIGGSVEDIDLIFNKNCTPYVRERIWHRSQVATPLPGGELRLQMRVGLSPELETWLLGFGPSVEVVQPTQLAARIRRLHTEAGST
jgi:predicted DNA-binding transcriptional regulator YafY